MSMIRTRSVSTKVTDDEYATLEKAASGATVSEWVRGVLLAAAGTRPSSDVMLMGELLALRTIVLNLHYALAAGETVTFESMQRLIARADGDKRRNAEARLAARAADEDER
jgi:hypothetical protein